MSKQPDHYRSFTVRLNSKYPDEAKLIDILDDLIKEDKKKHGDNEGGLRRMLPEMVQAYMNERAKVKPLTPERRLERLLIQTMEGIELRLTNAVLENIASVRPGLLTRIDQGEPAYQDGDSDVINGAFLDVLASEFEGGE